MVLFFQNVPRFRVQWLFNNEAVHICLTESQLFKILEIDFIQKKKKKTVPDLAKTDISPLHSKNHLKYIFNFKKSICNLQNILLHDY